jgi:hypothetical protein
MKALQWCPTLPLLLLGSLLLPTELSFNLGPLRLTVARVILLSAFFPALFRLVGGKAGRMNMIDTLVLLYLLWALMVLMFHHGIDVALQSGGILIVELGGAYLIARTWVLNERAYRGVTLVLIALICLLAPLVLFEAVTHFPLIKSLAIGHVFHSAIDPRMGLARAYGPFDHPIHLGVISASLLGIVLAPALPRLGQPRQPKFTKYGVLISAVSSLSSGGVFTLGIQAILLLWIRLTRGMSARWIKLAILFSLVYGVIELLSNRSAMIVFLTYLTFSADTAYNRVMIFDWGMDNVRANPIVGIGFNEWMRPDWVSSSSMDNFWLVQAVTYGIPGFLLLAVPTLMMVSRGWKECHGRLRRLRAGWTISMLGLMFAATTVHLWNNLLIYFAFMLGLGAWFHNVRRLSAKDESDYAHR